MDLCSTVTCSCLSFWLAACAPAATPAPEVTQPAVEETAPEVVETKPVVEEPLPPEPSGGTLAVGISVEPETLDPWGCGLHRRAICGHECL